MMQLTDFNKLRILYDNNQFTELIHNPDGIYWLKLRSLSRTEQLRELCQKADIRHERIPTKLLLKSVYEAKLDESLIDNFTRDQYERERADRKKNEDYLISQLYQMKVFNWGGLYQNSLEQTIINNYVKKVQDWDALNQAIENELHASLRGYVQCSWYNHWTSIIIEDIFKDHPAILPTIGLIKKVDFFINNFPFDLKVTYFPEGYMKELRRNEGLRPELTELKAFCRQEDIWFDQDTPDNVLFLELLAKVNENPSASASEYINKFIDTRKRLIQKTMNDPQELKIWLYENQGIRRFDSANRFFLILLDMNNLEESWKLKRMRELLAKKINSHLDAMKSTSIKDLKLQFEWQNDTYETYAETLFIFR